MIDGRLAADEAGEGTPVVLLHGLTATRRYVVMGSKNLERGGHRVIAYDARGHGASAPAPAPEAYSYEDLAADLRDVLDERGVDAAVLAGASMGAHTIVRFALDNPERVRAVVLITPAYDPDRGPSGLERWDALSNGLRSGGVEGFLAAYGEPPVPPQWRETVETILRQRLGRHRQPEAVADALRAVPRSQPFGDLSELAALEAIPAVVVADRDEADPEHPLEVAEAYAAAIPGATLAVEDPGKSPLAWQGSQVSRIIAEVAARA